MVELIEESSALESTTVGIYRTATVVKGGRRFSFAAMVVVGDRNGSVGIGYGKAPGVPAAIEKAQKDAKKNLTKVCIEKGTLPHVATARFGASTIKLIPAAPGTGVIAGATARAVLELVGVRDCLTKAYGSTNQKNLCRAVLEALKMMRNKETIQNLRGVEVGTTEVEQRVASGLRYAPSQSTTGEKAQAPVNTVGQKNAKGGRRRGGAPRKDAAPAEAAASTEEAKPAEAPAAEASE